MPRGPARNHVVITSLGSHCRRPHWHLLPIPDSYWGIPCLYRVDPFALTISTAGESQISYTDVGLVVNVYF
jgi:hypothetical protein